MKHKHHQIKYYIKYLNWVRSVKGLNCAMSVECLGHFSGIVPSVAFILTKPHGICSGKHLLKTSGNAILVLKISKCSQMPWSSRTCAFSASTKATYYSLWACCLKTFWQPWMSFLSLLFNGKLLYCCCKNSYTVEALLSRHPLLIGH